MVFFVALTLVFGVVVNAPPPVFEISFSRHDLFSGSHHCLRNRCAFGATTAVRD